MANDHGGTNRVEHERRRQQLNEFLADSMADVARMRGMQAELEGGEAAAWERLQTLAHNLAARAQILNLGVLNACTRELQQLVDDRQKGAPFDAFFLQCVSSAIETLALELESLRRA